MNRMLLLILLALPMTAQVRIVQTNAAGDEAHVIDPATNKVTLRIPNLEAAHGVGFSADGRTAYFTVEADSTVKAVDLRTGKIVGSVKLTGHPNNISVSKDGHYAFVAIAVAPGAVDVIDTRTMKLAKSVPINGAVHNTYVTPDGKYAVAGTVGTSLIVVIDAVTLEKVWETKLSAGVRPMAFEAGADGSTARIFAQLTNFHGFVAVDFKTHQEVARVTLPDQPKNGVAHSGSPAHGMAVTSDGKTLVVNSAIAAGVFFYSLPELQLVGFAKTGPVPDWVTLTPDGKTAYVASAGTNTVSVVDIAQRKEVAKIPVGEVPKRNGTVNIR
jgi:YVTN family beta-propeller protein